MKGEKHIAAMDFGEYLRKLDVSEKSKVYYGNFMEGIVILVKVDEKYNILKSLLATRYRSRDEGGIG